MLDSVSQRHDVVDLSTGQGLADMALSRLNVHGDAYLHGVEAYVEWDAPARPRCAIGASAIHGGARPLDVPATGQQDCAA